MQIDQLVLRWAGTRADQPALADAGGSLTYGELGRDVRGRAAALQARGVKAGDRVMLIGDNSVAFFATHLAILHVGAVSVPLAGATAPERIAHIARDAEATLLASARPIAGIDAVPLVELASSAEPVSVAVAPDATCCLMYTTGSTGMPKGVVLTHRSLDAAIRHIVAYLGYDGSEREAVVLPLSHSFGIGHVYCTLGTGGFVWLGNGLARLRDVLAALKNHEITAMPTTPSMLRLLLGLYRAAFLPVAAKFRQMVVDSEPLPPLMAEDLLAALPNVDLVVYYGLTEASRSTFNRLRTVPKGRLHMAGKAAPSVSIEIVAPDGSSLPVGQEGEVKISGPHLAVGYWRQPEEQTKVFRDGGVMTGDLGFLDAEGFLSLTGRLKDQINVGGLKVSPAEVEAVLRDHPAIADVAVAGVPDPLGQTGEAVAVAVVGKGEISERDIEVRCAERLEPVMQPKVIRMVRAIPRSETGKVLRGELRALLIDGSDGKSS
jgi:acyl-CoA synthetase (AMP-forming)/AMP-acid ligase II